MKVIRNKKENELELICTGRLESTTAPVLEEEVKAVDGSYTVVNSQFFKCGIRIIRRIACDFNCTEKNGRSGENEADRGK